MGERNDPNSQVSETVESDIEVASVSDDPFASALLKNRPDKFSWASIQLYAACAIGFFTCTMNGYNGSLINNLLANGAFLDYYHGSNSGIWSALVTSIYQFGILAAFPFAGPAVDTWGRRPGLLIGCVFIIVGTIVQGTSTQIHVFMGGSFLLGFGIAISQTAGPTYIVEISHPAHRGIATAIYHTFWFTGSIVASGAARGTASYNGDASWRIIVWLQLLVSGLIALFVMFLPESPRWLYVNNQQARARSMLVKYHGNGDENSEWVSLQLSEYNKYLLTNGADKRWWDYRALIRNRPAMYRLYCNCVVSLFSQWMGNAVLGYFMSAVLEIVGYVGIIPQLNLILINNCQEFGWSILGSLLVDKFGRRFLLLFANIGCSLVWAGMTATTYEFTNPSSTTNTAAAQGALAMIFIFSAIYCFGMTPLQSLYPVEVLSFEMRAKGMALSNFVIGAAGLLNQFAWPVAMNRIGWATYMIFSIWCAFQAIVVYFTIVETKNRTLEELDDIFNSPNPVKASLKRRPDVAGGIVMSEHAHEL